MYIKPCSCCNRLPKITECPSKDGRRTYYIACPNLCRVLKPQNNNKYDRLNRFMILVNDDVDYNTLYKKWNEELE